MLIHIGFALVGVCALGLMIHQTRAATLGEVLGRAVMWLPLLILLEAARIAGDAGSTWMLYRRWGASVPTGALLRAHLVAYPISILMPAGRSAAEAFKAAALAPHATGPRAAAVATLNQSLALLAGAIIGLPCLGASLLITGVSALSIALAVQVAITTIGGIGLQLTIRHRAIAAWLGRSWVGRRFARAAAATDHFQAALCEHPLIPRRALGAMMVNRVAQALQFGVLLVAVAGSASVGHSLLAQGINLVGTSIGDLVPAQIGVTDGAFALGAAALGITAAAAIAMSVIAHFVQILWCVAGCVAPLLWKAVGHGAVDERLELERPLEAVPSSVVP